MKSACTKSQIILGIDPGYAIVGYGAIETNGSKMRPIDYGVLRTDVNMPFPDRLERLFMGMRMIIERFNPDCIAFEELFFARNTKTAMFVSAARGVLVLAAQQSCRPLYEYTPMQIKQAVTGDGHADKIQVQSMVKMLLNLDSLPQPDDAADAVAVAICHGGMLGPAAQEFLIK